MTIILHPARHDPIGLLGELDEGEVDPAMRPPATDFSANLRQGVLVTT